MARIIEAREGAARTTKRRNVRARIGGAILAGSLLAGAPVLAADMPVKAPVVVPAYSWSGFYLGAHAGYGWSRGNARLQPVLLGVPTTLAERDLEEIPEFYRVNASGFIGGGQIGFNQQMNRAVLGIEADLSYAGLKGTATAAGSATSGGPPVTRDFLVSESQRLNWLATLRARFGILTSDALLLYVTGGLAVGQIKESTFLSFSGLGGTTFIGTASSTRAGWTVGGGGEYRIGGNWTAKLEYLFFDLGRNTVRGIDTVSPNQPFQTQATFDFKGQLVRAGLNLKLN
jgi:outer membrane immunogenic protein